MTIQKTPAAFAVTVALLLAAAAPSHALTKCKAIVHRPTGVIQVSAKDVAGTLMWGDQAGQEINAFANIGTCVVDTSAKKCELGAPGSPEQVTPPQLCRIYLFDGTSSCSALVLGCTPGLREAVAGPSGPTGPSGPSGPAGPSGPSGPSPTLTYVTCTGPSNSGAGASSSCTATCPMGTTIAGGVCGNNTAVPQFVQGVISDPGTNTVWSCTVKNQNATATAIAAAGTAICMPQ